MLELANIQKTYRMGDTDVHALAGVSFRIDEGDYVAIMGPSGSGKSTLMHVLGLLDAPSAGSYRIDGKEVSRHSEDELAVLRRNAVGFVFQQFNLLPRLTALENVALPLLYSNHEIDLRRAETLLQKTGLGKRVQHKPSELSGGQQQRVAIARSLINRPRLILADEPTGNLDSTSESDILATLKELNSLGMTVIVVTHEEEIGRQAKRLIRMRDGAIVSDERLAPYTPSGSEQSQIDPRETPRSFFWEMLEYFKQGFKTLTANKVRTGLSMLGILIGVAAVVAVLALGHGAQQSIETQLASLGSNLLVIRPGAVRVGGVAQESGLTTRLTLEDADALKDQVSSVKNSAPAIVGRAQITFQNKNWSTQITGAHPDYARMHDAVPLIGRFFNDDENQKRSRVAVIGATVVRQIFGGRNPIGEMIKINKVNFQVIGILPEKGANGWRDQDDMVIIPVLTAMHRLLGKDYIDYIELEIHDESLMDEAQKRSLDLMYTRHRIPISQRQGALEVRNMADIQAALTESSRSMSLLLSSIAAISLLVGGIGIMNIMLVSVTERTREIGLRKALGAKRWNILAQFLAESVVVSTVGGLIGIAIGWLITAVLANLAGWTTSITVSSAALAFAFSATIGVVFGLYPARKASLLHPIVALRYE